MGSSLIGHHREHRDSTTGLLSTSITPSFPFIVQMLYIFCFAFESQVDVFVFVCFFHVVSSLIWIYPTTSPFPFCRWSIWHFPPSISPFIRWSELRIFLFFTWTYHFLNDIFVPFRYSFLSHMLWLYSAVTLLTAMTKDGIQSHLWSWL